jgi:hypothetical protein
MSVAFGCYTPKAWARLYEVIADPETMADSYEDFLESAEEKIKAIEARGLTTAKILIDPDTGRHGASVKASCSIHLHVLTARR